MRFILATDVGSTTTKARLFQKMETGEWRYVKSGEAPTTVEAPFEDVTMGVLNAVREVEELTGHMILAGDKGIITPFDGEKGVDLYCTTSSAGGGLQMMVSGVVKRMTAESANRAALGAGAIVMEVLANNDGRLPYEKIRLIRNLRPDMILMAGGTEGGTINHVVQMAELVKTADPKPRLGVSYLLPIVYCGNNDAKKYISDILTKNFALTIVDNIRPVLEVENTEPARRAVHELFMEHVMSHAPGYDKLMKWVDIDIMPTPAGEGMSIQLIAKNYNADTIGVGLGGATTNVYSIFDGRFVRSVSANLGMSYSICNVLKEAKINNIMRWIPYDIDEADLRNRLRNKMIRPTTIPHTLKELIMEHAVAREAIRLGINHHKSIASRLKGTRGEVLFDRGILSQVEELESYVDMMKVKYIAGTGGLLSHAPRRIQSLVLLNDSFLPEGVTMLFQDSVFMMPHLGVLSTVYPEAAWQIFDKDCLVRLGSVIAPSGVFSNLEEIIMEVTMEMPNGDTIIEKLKAQELKRINLPERQKAKTTIKPGKEFDVGNGVGKELITEVEGGVAGVLLDTRGRPLVFPEDDQSRKKLLLKWMKAVDMYPQEVLEDIGD
jgi:uncharacterized protein (TIGR01319 family)